MVIATVWAFAGSLVLTLVLIAWLRPRALLWGLVDHPDGRRKTHARITPLVGGLAIFGAVTATLGLVLFMPGSVADDLTSQSSQWLGLLLAAALIVAVGVADDLGRLRGRHKLFGQTIAALIVVQAGLAARSLHLFGARLDLGPLTVPFTVLWLLACINSLNLLDGMDGLLGTVGLILCLALAGAAAAVGAPGPALVALALAGALAGFLCFNLPPASVFLGDAGSMLVGLMIGALSLETLRTETGGFPLAVPLALLTLPFCDTAAALARRTLTGRSIYATDRGHLHHCLLRRGLSVRRVLVYVALLCLTLTAGALLALACTNESIALGGSVAVVAFLLLSGLFGTAEAVLVRKRLAALVNRARGRSRQTEVALQGSAAWSDLWGEVVACAPRLKLVAVRLNVNVPALHEGYHARWDAGHADSDETLRTWRVELPLRVGDIVLGRLEAVGRCDGRPVEAHVVGVTEMARAFETSAEPLLRQLGAAVPAPADSGDAIPSARGLVQWADRN